MPITVFRAGETITPGNIVAVTQDSVVKKAVVNDPQVFKAIGVATTSGNAGDAVKVVVDDQVHIFSGLTPGNSLYLSTTPGSYTSSYAAIPSGVATSLNGSANLSPFARAISASGITLQTPAAVVADVSSQTITLENTPTNNIFNFLTEYGIDVIRESGSSTVWAKGGDLTYTINVGGIVYRVHEFRTPGTSNLIVANGGTIEFLIVGGGGGGGTNMGGGGGAGEFVEGTTSIIPSTFSVTVGDGGLAGQNGVASSFLTKTAKGGGAGNSLALPGNSGGSGGGGGGNGASGGASTAADGFGNVGGTALVGTSNKAAGAGGGGAGSAGNSGYVAGNGDGIGGDGGTGRTSQITGTLSFYAAGGGGGQNNGSAAGQGGSLVGGTGANNFSNSTAGATNTGSGGGGAANVGSYPLRVAARGGSGIIVVRYAI